MQLNWTPNFSQRLLRTSARNKWYLSETILTRSLYTDRHPIRIKKNDFVRNSPHTHTHRDIHTLIPSNEQPIPMRAWEQRQYWKYVVRSPQVIDHVLVHRVPSNGRECAWTRIYFVNVGERRWRFVHMTSSKWMNVVAIRRCTQIHEVGCLWSCAWSIDSTRIFYLRCGTTADEPQINRLGLLRLLSFLLAMLNKRIRILILSGEDKQPL